MKIINYKIILINEHSSSFFLFLVVIFNAIFIM